jgi:acyl-CoA reductase-like NAD-dependent aldehyde dehydrogenase
MSGIGGLSFGMVATGSSAGTATQTAAEKPGAKAVDDFLAYMKKSLAERMADAWLAAHGLDREKLKAMPPEQRDAVLKQMTQELKEQLTEAAAKTTSRKTDAA